MPSKTPIGSIPLAWDEENQPFAPPQEAIAWRVREDESRRRALALAPVACVYVIPRCGQVMEVARG